MQEINAAIRLGHELSEQRDRAFDLWTWLPSCKAAQKEHGDYFSEHMPSVADILSEAATFISHGLAPSAEQIMEAGDYYRCPCGEDHDNPANIPPATWALGLEKAE